MMTLGLKENTTLTEVYKFCTESSFLNNQRLFPYVNKWEAGKNYSEWCTELWMWLREHVIHSKIMLVIRRIYCNYQRNMCLKLMIYSSYWPSLRANFLNSGSNHRPFTLSYSCVEVAETTKPFAYRKSEV